MSPIPPGADDPEGEPDVPVITGLAKLAQHAYAGLPFDALWTGLIDRAGRPQGDPGALMDMSMILQLVGSGEQGLEVQGHALAQSAVYRRTHGSGAGLRVLALVVAGDFMANTPLDFMLEGSDFTAIYLYVDHAAAMGAAPEHDVAFLAIGESEANDPFLAHLPPLLAVWPRPVVNGRPQRIVDLSRQGVARAFAEATHVVSPPAVRVARDRLPAAAAALAFPVIARPVGSHAGIGLSRLDDGADLAAYLAERGEAEFHVSPFVDYRSPDGRFRKYRIAFIGGRAFLSHLAISDHWMVHYLNAGMEDDAAKRAEEADCMARFDQDFAVRHRAAFEELTARIGLDYFAVDCAEAPDGRLLLFEADVAMIVHALDAPDLFPYKPAQMRKLFAAFQALLIEGAGRTAGAPAENV